MSTSSRMAPSNPVVTEAGEPSTYQQVEKVLSRAVGSDGEDTQETDSHGADLRLTCEGHVPHEDWESNPRHECAGSDHPPKDRQKEAFGVATSQNAFQESAPKKPISSKCQESCLQPVPLSQNQCSTPQVEVETNAPSSEAASRIAESVAEHTTAEPNAEPRQHAEDVTFPPIAIVTVDQNSKERHSSTLNQPNLASINMISSEQQGNNDDSQDQTGSPPGPPSVIHTDTHVGRLASLATPPVTSSVPGHGSCGGPSKSRTGTTLRRGKWTVEEEAYVARVIQDFNSGFLNAPAGTTLRSYLSDKLQCDPMRITKKFTGDACIGKRVFHPAVRSASNAATIDKAQAELDALERRWRRRLEMQQRESTKKAAASAAAASSPITGAGRGHGALEGGPSAGLFDETAPVHNQQNVVAQTASWLDRANAILKGSRDENVVGNVSFATPPAVSQQLAHAFDSMPRAAIENQMKEVQRLIYEGPLIQQTTAGLPDLIHQGIAAHQTHGHASNELRRTDVGTAYNVSQHLGAEPADKRMRTASTTGAEDAEALVGFLRSVRASAASAEEYPA